MRCSLVIAVILAAAPSARAEIAVLTNGLTFKTTSHRLEDSVLILALKGGGEVGLPPTAIRGFVPDEVLDEVVAPTGASADIRTLAIQAAERHGLDPDLVLAVVAVESCVPAGGQSPKGAQGLMQLMPATAAELGVKNAFDPAENLDGGARHLDALLTLYGGDLTRALAAYNAGVKAVEKSKGVPPYRETREYVRKVLKRVQATEMKRRPRTGEEGYTIVVLLVGIGISMVLMAAAAPTWRIPHEGLQRAGAALPRPADRGCDPALPEEERRIPSPPRWRSW